MKWLWWRVGAPSLVWFGNGLCTVALAAAQGVAAPEAELNSTSPGVVVRFVSTSNEGGEVAQLFEAIIAARRDDVTVVFEREPDTFESNDAVWVALDASRPTAWRLTLYRGARRFERELGTGIETDAAVVEAAALVAAQGVLALLERPEAELEDWDEVRPEQQTPVTDEVKLTQAESEDPVAPPPIQPWGSVFFGIGYEPVMFSKQSHVESGAAFSLGVWTRAGLELALSGAAYPDVEVRGEFGSFQVSHWPAQATAGWGFDVGDLRLGARAGLLLELRQRHSVSPSAFVAATEDASTMHPGGTLQGFADLPFASRWSLTLSVAGDWLPGRRYVAAGDTAPLLEPREIRPRADLSLRYHLPLGTD